MELFLSTCNFELGVLYLEKNSLQDGFLIFEKFLKKIFLIIFYLAQFMQ
jgi:hypothetical protein